MQSSVCSILVLTFVAAGAVAQAAAPPADALASGLARLQAGDTGRGLLELDGAARALEADPARRREAARAYALLADAYLSLKNEGAASQRYRRALALDPAVSRDTTLPASTRARLRETAQPRRAQAQTGDPDGEGGSKIGWILGGVGVAGAAVAILASRGGGLSDPTPTPTGPPPGVTPTPTTPSANNRAPSVSIREIQPTGQGIIRVTRFSFAADASDPDVDSVRVAWDFGDGTTGDGLGVAHIFNREGTFDVRATATDGRGGSASATRALTARSLSGSWNRGTYTTTLSQEGSTLRGSGNVTFDGTLSDPYGVSGSIRRNGCATTANWSGTVALRRQHHHLGALTPPAAGGPGKRARRRASS
jgi:hypothetical protein